MDSSKWRIVAPMVAFLSFLVALWYVADRTIVTVHECDTRCELTHIVATLKRIQRAVDKQATTSCEVGRDPFGEPVERNP